MLTRPLTFATEPVFILVGNTVNSVSGVEGLDPTEIYIQQATDLIMGYPAALAPLVEFLTTPQTRSAFAEWAKGQGLDDPAELEADMCGYGLAQRVTPGSIPDMFTQVEHYTLASREASVEPRPDQPGFVNFVLDSGGWWLISAVGAEALAKPTSLRTVADEASDRHRVPKAEVEQTLLTDLSILLNTGHVFLHTTHDETAASR